ncbi:MAG: hypothetical protein IKU98_01435 [Bacteroidaceae bacterium]|nr:hypothetical protein [Bacteroidaceae bacterium]
MIEIKSTVRCDKCKKELPDPWMTFDWKDGTKSHICKECVISLNKWLREPVEEEYPLTFEQALKEMLNGKTVQSEYDINTLVRFNSGKSCFEELSHSSYRWEPILTIWRKLQKGKWRVVG